MTWKKGDTMYWMYADTGYNITRAVVKGENRYKAWNPAGEYIGGPYYSADEAREACEID